MTDGVTFGRDIAERIAELAKDMDPDDLIHVRGVGNGFALVLRSSYLGHHVDDDD